jgi:hypothetical protein
MRGGGVAQWGVSTFVRLLGAHPGPATLFGRSYLFPVFFSSNVFLLSLWVPGLKETRVGVSKGNLDEDLRHGRRASPCIRLWVLRMPTLPRINKS